VQIFDHPETDRRLPPAKDGDAPEENAWPDRDTTRYRDFVQAFSHFTYEATQGSLLVCDLQGVFMAKQPFAESSRPGLDLPHGAKQLDSQDGSNSGEWVPTFRLTDPVIHDVSRAKARAAEDGWGIKKESEVGGARTGGSRASLIFSRRTAVLESAGRSSSRTDPKFGMNSTAFWKPRNVAR